MRKQNNKGLFFKFRVLFYMTAAAWCLLTAGRFHAARSFWKNIEKEPEPALTSMEFRYEKKFQNTLSHYRFFGSLYQSEYSSPVPGLKATDILGKSCGQMVPQGICIAGDYMLITAYDSGEITGKNTRRKMYPSALYVLSNQNPKERRLLTTIILPDVNHVGGVAFDGANVWIAKSTDRQCSVISYERIREAVDSGKSSVELLNYDQNVPCGVIASFVTWHDNKLWVGTYTNRISGNGWLRSFQVEKETGVPKENGESGHSFTLQKQDEIVIPGFANGASFVKRGEKTYLAVTTSRGRYFDSRVYFYEVHQDIYTGKNVYYSYSSCRFPPMAEELICDGDSTYFLFESSATCYSTPVYRKCSYPVDRICAVSTWKLFRQNQSGAWQRNGVGSVGKQTLLHPGATLQRGQKMLAYFHSISGRKDRTQDLFRDFRWGIFGINAVCLPWLKRPSDGRYCLPGRSHRPRWRRHRSKDSPARYAAPQKAFAGVWDLLL